MAAGSLIGRAEARKYVRLRLELSCSGNVFQLKEHATKIQYAANDHHEDIDK